MAGSNKTLNIELHPGYFCYAVIDLSSNTVKTVDIKYIQSTSNEYIDTKILSKWLKDHQEIWSMRYQTINITVYGYPSTITPDKAGGILSLKNLFPVSDTHIEYMQFELNDKIICTFCIPQEITNILNSYFINVNITSGPWGLIKHLLHDRIKNQIVNLHITPGKAYFFHIQGDKLNYYNTFEYSNQEDLLYFTLLVFKMLQLSTDETSLQLSGFIETDSEIYKILYQYVRNIEIKDYAVHIDSDTQISDLVVPNYLSNILHLSS